MSQRTKCCLSRVLMLSTFLSFGAVGRAFAQIQSVAPGDWSNPAIWDGGEPGVSDEVIVRHPITITQAGELCRLLDIRRHAKVTLASGDFATEDIVGLGEFLQTGGVLQCAPHPALGVGRGEPGRLTLRGGTLLLPDDALILGDLAGEARFRIEGSESSIQVRNLIVGGDTRLVLSPTQDGPDGLSPIFGPSSGSGSHSLTLEPQFFPQPGDEWLFIQGTGRSIISPLEMPVATEGVVQSSTTFGTLFHTTSRYLKVTNAGTPYNDCTNAAKLPSQFADTPYIAYGATTDGLGAGPYCDYGSFGDEQNHNDVWFTYTPEVGGCTYISTLDLAGYDTRITVYSGYACPDIPANIIACADDEVQPRVGDFEAGLDVDLVAGQTYTIRLGTGDANTPARSGILRIAQGPGADRNSRGLNPGALGCRTRHIPLNYNFNGIIHPREQGRSDTPIGYRSIADRGFWFNRSVESEFPLTYRGQYSFVAQPFELDIVHLGNRNVTGGGAWAFDGLVDGDDIGVQPSWLPSVDQSGPQTTVLAAPIPLDSGASLRVLCHGTDGGTTLDVTLGFSGGGTATFPVSAGDWTGGMLDGFGMVDSGEGPGALLGLTENVIDLSPHSGQSLTQITFENAGHPDRAVAIFAANLDTGGLRPSNDDCANALTLPTSFADTAYDPTGAQTDGADALGVCDYGSFGDELNHQDIWFRYTPDVGGCTYISTLNLAGYDTRLTIYESDSCPDDPASIIACTDSEVLPAAAPFEAGLDVTLQQGQTYLIRLGSAFASTALAPGFLRIAAGPGAATHSGGGNPGAPGCVEFTNLCNGDGGDQMGCTHCPCTNNAPAGTTGGCLNSAGTSSRLSASGHTSVSHPIGDDADLRFAMSAGPPSATCVLISGVAVAPLNMANPCSGLASGVVAIDRDGLRCAVQQLQRHGNRQTNPTGDIMDSMGPHRVWGGEAQPIAGLAIQGGFVSGQTRFFQVTHRDDPAAVCLRGLNTSQAIEVTFTP